MSKKIRIGTLAIALCVLAMGHVNGQADILGHTGGGTQHIGWDVNTTIPLQIRHDAGDQPIEFYTTGDAEHEVIIMPTLTNYTFGQYTLDVSGHVEIGDFSFGAPLTFLHINEDLPNSITEGIRPWMRPDF